MDFKELLNDNYIPLMQEMIRNKCVNTGDPDSGNETRSAETLKRYFDTLGIESELIAERPNRASILATIPGTDPIAPSLMFMGHTDVVPANPADWSVDPFEGVVKDGYLWGRGTVDMLNMTAGSAVAFAELASQGKQYPGTLMYLAVADEEASGRLGARWLLENHWEKVKTDYMITELGGFFTGNPRTKGISITLGEKGVCWAKITVKGKAGHGSMPYKANNAVFTMADVIKRLEKHKTPVNLYPLYKDMAKGLAQTGIQEWLLSTKWGIEIALADIYKTSPGIAKFLHTASRTSISPNLADVGKKVNIIADEGTLYLDIRLLPDQTVEDVQKELTLALGPLTNKVEIEFTDFFPSNVSSKNTPLFQAVEEITRDSYPDTELVPMMIGGVTDGRYWRQRNTTVYGFSLFDEDMTLTSYSDRLHGKDEKIALSSLQKTLEFFYKLPERFYRRIDNNS